MFITCWNQQWDNISNKLRSFFSFFLNRGVIWNLFCFFLLASIYSEAKNTLNVANWNCSFLPQPHLDVMYLLKMEFCWIKNDEWHDKKYNIVPWNIRNTCFVKIIVIIIMIILNLIAFHSNEIFDSSFALCRKREREREKREEV